MRALVIGSGIGGLACGLGLRRVGVEFTLYERAPELREVGAGIMLWANALRALDALGAGDAVRAVSEPVAAAELAAADGRRVQSVLPAGEMEKRIGFAPAAAFAHRAELVAALAGLLPPGVARYGHELVGVEPAGDRVRARFANGHTDEADLLIAADGLRSRVRAELFGPSDPRPAGYACWRGIAARPAGMAPGELKLWTGRGSQVGLNPLPGDRVYWFATINTPPGTCPADHRAALRERFGRWAAPLPELIETTPDDKILWADILDRPPARPWSKGRCVLIGDAAHPTTPNFGQGGGLAIEDAVALARCLTANRADPPAAFRAFEAERYARTAAVTVEAWRFGRLLQWEGAAGVWLRDRLSGLLVALTGSRNLVKHARYDPGRLSTAHGW